MAVSEDETYVVIGSDNSILQKLYASNGSIEVSKQVAGQPSPFVYLFIKNHTGLALHISGWFLLFNS